MKKISIKPLLLASMFALVVLAVPGQALYAQDTGDVQQETEETTVQTKKEENQAKLQAKKLQNCERREAKINSLMARIADRGEKQMAVFTKIADRTIAFYEDKGRTVDNYAELITEVDAKKLAAQTSIDAITETAVDFDCDSEDPKQSTEAFKTALKSEIAALKEYKTAIKNLIVGVKSAQSTATDQAEGEEE